MSILIKGMEMPKNCLSCPLQGGTADCRLTQKTYNWGLTERPSDCPLVPVPPHGRLIDADEAIGHLFNGEQCLYSWDEIEEAIDATETVIPAEEVKE